MAFVKADRVQEQATFTGAGDIVLGGIYDTSYRTFASQMADGDTCQILTINMNAASEWEIDEATYVSSTNSLQRTVLLSSSTGSTVSFTSGVKRVAMLPPASAMVVEDNSGNASVANNFTVGGALTVTGNASVGGNLTVTGDIVLDDISVDTAVFRGATSGTTTVQANGVASGTLTLPAATDTLVGKATTDTLTNKTFNTAGTGNVFQINSNTVSAYTGTGSTAVLSASPTLTGTLTVPSITAPAATDLILNAPTGQTINHTINSVSIVKMQSNAMYPTTTGAIDLGGAGNRWAGLYTGTANLSGALTYGGVTLSNSVTGTGSMVLSSNPTFTTGISTPKVGIGFTSAITALNIPANITGGTAANAVNVGSQIQSDVTAQATAYNSTLSTQAAAFTVGTVTHYWAQQGTIGATSAVTTQIGFRVGATLTGATNNYGFYSALNSAANVYAFYGAGTAANYLGGATTLAAALTYGGVTLANSVTGTGSMVLSTSPQFSTGIGINAAAASGILLNMQGAFGGFTGVNGAVLAPTLQSSVTSSYIGYYSAGNTAAAAFTLPTVRHFQTNGLTPGSGAAITNQYGFMVESTFTQATNNFAFYSGLNSGTGRYNIYMAGTADNYFGGVTTFNLGVLNAAGETIYNGTAIPAGGTTGTGYKFSSTANFGVFFGSGAPTLSAAQGSLYVRSDGAPYYNNNGTTGWTQIGAGITAANDSSTASDLYPLFAASATGTLTSVYTDNGDLNFKPSTGEFKARVPVANNGIFVNSQTVSTDYTIASGYSGTSAGPVTVASGKTVTVSSGSKWVVL